MRINDRGIDRSKGVWSNNIDSKFNVGIAATDDNVFFAWQDTRNAIGQTDSEDIYASTLPLTGAEKSGGSNGIPGWTLLFAIAIGLGLGICAAWLVVRRRPASAAPKEKAARGDTVGV